MDIDGVALVIGAGMAIAAFIQCVEENSTLISYLTGSGIGREVALTLASRGAHTIVCADINLAAAEQTARMSRSRKAGHVTEFKVRALHVDVRDEHGVQQMVNEAKSLFGRIDYFVNTAGFGASRQTEITSMSLEDYRSMDEVHNVGSFLCLRTVLKTMLQQVPRPMPVAGRPTISSPRHMSRGSIVILTSLASDCTFLGVGNYSAAKHAVKGLVQTAAIENARKSIRINAVAPSKVSGPMINKVLDDVPGLKASMLRDLAIPRPADPEEVADAVVFLASTSASYVNGHTLVVDGGSSLLMRRMGNTYAE